MNNNPIKEKVRTNTILYSKDPRDLSAIAKNIPCQNACPANTNIPGYIRCIYEKRYGRSYDLNRMYNVLPGVLGRICSRPCELMCRHGDSDLGEPVSICYLKRSAADLKSPMHRIKENLYESSGKKVAVIGAGPSGLAAARELSLLGHKVKIFEGNGKHGGMLMYGIPEFRLPRDILNIEVENILRLGIDIEYNAKVGDNITLDSILKKFDSVILTTGCSLPNQMRVEGEDLEGVYNGLEFMKMINDGEKPEIGDKVIIIGDGFTAMDCARAAARLGAKDVKVNMRKTEEFMPIDEKEKFEVKYEKVKFYSLVDTQRIIGENGKVKEIEFLRNRLIDSATASGGRAAEQIENSEFTLEAETVIIAIGQQPDPTSISSKIKTDGNWIKHKKDSFQTSVKKLFAAGDCLTGASNVISAIAAGRKCAHEVDNVLTGKARKDNVVRFEMINSTDRQRSFDFIEKIEIPSLKFQDRFKSRISEVETGYDGNIAYEEAKRCYLCNLKYEIDVSRCIYCSACIDVAPRDCIKMVEKIDLKKDPSGKLIETQDWNKVTGIVIDTSRCIRCGVCYEVCPMDCIYVTKTELIEYDLEG
ncbi:MAG: FAD-dependent oxidoreductase [Desulfobacterales bacterium]|nr:FAD-dependent oxidoreductase [Desulfobacterales bacterium]MCP4164227.1 FAD-dependent oxidoreductase [Deltaproteobacteria bacterium]